MIKSMQGIVLLISCLHFGCATMFTPPIQGVYVDSEPREAKVRSNKLYQEETTPAFMNMKKGGDIYLDIAKEGYYTNSLQLNKTMAPGFLLNFLLFELAPVGLFIDWQTGAMWNYQDRVIARLEKKGVSDPAASTGMEEKSPRSFNSMNIPPLNQRAKETNLSGPRIGFTYLSRGSIQEIKREEDIDVKSVITQFGWQFEKGIRPHEDSPTFVLELIPLLGGLDQSVDTATVFSFIGIRSESGLEFALGPTWYQNTTAVGYSGVITLKYHKINVPLNLIVVPGKSGTSVSLLTGFSW